MKLSGEYGKLGQYRYDGWFSEEFLLELRGRRGAEAYKEMAENDSVVGAILFAIEMLMRQVTWNVERQGNQQADIDAAAFINSCMGDMDEPWTNFISEVSSFLTFGWAYHEIVYKRRMGRTRNPATKSKYDDGLIGWQKLPIRSQDTLWRWKYDDNDNLLGLIQSAPPMHELVFIPIEKALHFVTKSRKANPEGRSVLRPAYREFYFKRRIEELEGIGIERDLAGLPVIHSPENALLEDDDGHPTPQVLEALRVVKNIRRDEQEGVVMPFGWELKLLTTGGQRQFDTSKIIQQKDSRIAMTVLADFIMLGHETSGSWALSSDKTKLFGIALGGFLDTICEVFNTQAIPRLIDLNGDAFAGITDYPRLVHGDVDSTDITQLSAYVKSMVDSGVITPDERLEEHMRLAADLPEREDLTLTPDKVSTNTAAGTAGMDGEEDIGNGA